MAFDFSVTGNTKLDTSGFTQGVSSMTVAAGTLIADLVKTASSQLTNLAQSAIKNGSVYETSLAKVGTIADLGTLSIQQLGSQITDMSNTMGIAATDIAEATYQAISAGQDTANAVEFAGQAAKLATAGFTSTTSAVDILTTALNAYGLSADQATHVSDVLLTTQNLGKTSVDELSSSMGKVIPLAAAYNVSVENLSSGLAVMTANGIATAEATTYTKSMLNELGDTGSSVGKILQQQTGKSFAQLSANGKSLGDVLQVLYDSVGDDGTAFAGLWSSVEAGTGALSLVSGGADKFNGVLAQMVDSAGATETAYATMTDTFQHSMDSLQTTAGNFSIVLFDSLEPGLTQAAQWGTDCLSTLTEALTEGGPEAMLDAASAILENLTEGIVQAIPGLASAATQAITQLVQYLADHQDAIFDAGIQLLEQLIIGITDNLPQLITAAAELIAKFSAALISHLPDILKCGAAFLTTLVDGIVRSIENLGEAALACIAKLTGIWDGSMDDWGHIGENIVQHIISGIAQMWNSLVSYVNGLIASLVNGASSAASTGVANAVSSAASSAAGSTASSTTQANRNRRRQAALAGQGISTKSWTERQAEAEAASKAAQQAEKTVTTSASKAQSSATKAASTTSSKVKQEAAKVVSTTKSTDTDIIDGARVTVETTTELLADGSEQVSTITTRTGKEIIDGVERTVKTVTTRTAEGVETTVRTIEDAGPQYASAGELLTTQLRQKLDDGWEDIQSAIQEDALGAIGKLANALKNGDLESLGLWAASYFWQACTKEQQAQIQAVALGALNQLSGALSGVFGDLSQLATGLVAQFVPAAASATAGQTALNVALDANPIGLVISLIGMLVGALLSFAGTNEDVASGFKQVWSGVRDFMSVIFEGLLRIVGLSIQGFVDMLNGLIATYNFVAQAWDGQIDYVKNPAWEWADKLAAERKKQQEEQDKGTGKDDDPNKALTDAVQDNTEALLSANKKLAEMVRQASGLVLSDNMAVTRSVAASGTAQVAAAASQYHSATTNITQNIYAKAQTAADLQREARWEADRARAQKR